MKKLPLCLTAVICFSLLNIACIDEGVQCRNLYDTDQYDKALPHCDKSCNRHDGEGCFNLGYLYANGLGVEQDYRKAKIYFERACNNLNVTSGCFNLGYLYANGLGVRQNYQQAITYYEIACNRNSGSGCYNLGVLYYKGEGVRQSDQTAKEYFGKSCDSGDQGGCDKYRELNQEELKSSKLDLILE